MIFLRIFNHYIKIPYYGYSPKIYPPLSHVSPSSSANFRNFLLEESREQHQSGKAGRKDPSLDSLDNEEDDCCKVEVE